MSVQALSWAMVQSTYRPADKLVLIHLADRCDMDGFASLDGVEAFSGLSAPEVSKAVLSLARQDLIEFVDGAFRVMAPIAESTRCGAVPAHVRKTMIAEAGGVCSACGGTDRLAIDHIIPRSRGGNNDRSNLQVLCSPCNSSKRNKLPGEWKGRVTA